MNFVTFREAIAKQFDMMQKYPLFRVDLDPYAVWDAYQAAFPAGTNEIYRTKPEHDCSCCRQFVKAVGNAVAIIDGEVVSVWDVGVVPDEPAYTTVAIKLAKLVSSKPIASTFLHFEPKAGAMQTLEQRLEGGVQRWNHFFANIKSQFVKAGSDIASALALPRDNVQVLRRSIKEISDDAVQTVLDLIADGVLYRGDEHKYAVTEFDKLRKEARRLDEKSFETWLWTKAISETGRSVIRIRNTAIGTLLTDLSEGMDTELAVKRFETVMAPANYKRPNPVITKAMVANAEKDIAALGRTSALGRRHARLDDITINNVVFANRESRKVMGESVFADLAASAPRTGRDMSKLQEIGIEEFIANVVPRAKSIEVLFESKHQGNLVSLVAPLDPTAAHLFKWDNNFSWSYNGEMADSIKERVKAAGGAVEGDLMCRLAWEYTDDLDFHMYEPHGGHINFSNRRSNLGGFLDVDANGGNGMMDHPVENIVYPDKKRMVEGDYRLTVHNFTKRDASAKGFEVEIEFEGQRLSIVTDQMVRYKQEVEVAIIRYSRTDGLSIVNSLAGQSSRGPGKQVWGIATNDFHKVNIAMLSPNHWDGHGVGNKHYFFMLEGCKNEAAPRGFFNEFLAEDLTKHRKVFEALGSKMRVEDSDDQLSGLGFSSTKRDSFVVRVSGATQRMMRVVV